MQSTQQGLIVSIKVTPLASKNEVLLSKEGAFPIKPWQLLSATKLA
jgi:hypothetical protein